MNMAEKLCPDTCSVCMYVGLLPWICIEQISTNANRRQCNAVDYLFRYILNFQILLLFRDMLGSRRDRFWSKVFKYKLTGRRLGVSQKDRDTENSVIEPGTFCSRWSSRIHTLILWLDGNALYPLMNALLVLTHFMLKTKLNFIIFLLWE